MNLKSRKSPNGGELRITFPSSKVNNQLTYVKMNELIRGYNTVQSAVNSFQEIDSCTEKTADYASLNICMSYTYINDSDAIYCMYCGTNLIVGRGEKILESLRRVISHRIISEAQTNDIQEINKKRSIKAEETDIPSELNEEFIYENECMAVNFILPDGYMISSPLIIAKKEEKDLCMISSLF